jgi:hypothetical protein|tara:strand:- start:822 stop:1616 length:795 start_codon:yes stop_codon:yes gene_type:complete
MAIATVLKHPLFLFSILGSFLFFVDFWTEYDRQGITVTAAQQQRLSTLWETQTGYAATPAQLDSLIANWIEEEILYQEALRLGLDEQDSIVRRRLIQKLGFIAESEPSEPAEISTLQNFYRENISSYTLPERYTFRQRYFQTETDANNALILINSGEAISILGEPSMLNSEYAYLSKLEINATFGTGFSNQITTTNTDSWQGPLLSGFGFHLVYLIAVHEEETTPFETMQDQVFMDYRNQQEQNARSNFVEDLTQKYSITIEPR